MRPAATGSAAAANLTAKMDKLQAQQGKPRVDIKDVQAQAKARRDLENQLKDAGKENNQVPPTDKNFSDFLKGQGPQTFGPTMNTNKPTKVDIPDAGDFYPESKNITNRGITNTSEASLGDYRKKAQLSQAGAKINKFFDRDDAAKVAAADKTIAKRQQGLNRADARTKPYTPPAHDAEKHQRDLTARYPNIDELVADAEKNRDPYYDRAEGNAYYAGREAEQNYQRLKQIQRVIQGLNESRKRTQP
jgi:hypothetical protein